MMSNQRKISLISRKIILNYINENVNGLIKYKFMVYINLYKNNIIKKSYLLFFYYTKQLYIITKNDQTIDSKKNDVLQ